MDDLSRPGTAYHVHEPSSSDTNPGDLSVDELSKLSLDEEHRLWLQRQQEQQRRKLWQKMVANIRFGGREASFDLRVGGKYKLRRKIGSGSFGQIFLAENILTREEVAVKLEECGKDGRPQLPGEAAVLQALARGHGFPRVRWSGMDGEFYVVAMDLLGLSLEDLFNVCHRTFSVHTTARLAVQILSRLEYMHGKAFIHRDVKPENFLLDYATGQEVNVIDFGLATAYRDGHTRQHIAYRSGIPLAGTARYASINAHNGIAQTRRDDLEALGYMLLYFLRGRLPWQDLQAASKVPHPQQTHPRMRPRPHVYARACTRAHTRARTGNRTDPVDADAVRLG
eukprot:m.1015774 g.1015774  ORF g.1015774 m.1015774 type:complete len:339 (+) comp24077_c0_seq36:244-1260(+)